MSSTEAIEAIVGTPSPVVRLKQLAALDEGSRSVLTSAPIAGFGFRDAQGHAHTTFVGGTREFARVESAGYFRFALPDDPLLPEQGSGVSFVFLLPGVGETLRLNGVVAERTGGDLRISVEEVFVHCARCILRSGLWNEVDAPPTMPPRGSEDRPSGPLGDPAIAAFLASAPFAIVSSCDAMGSSDTSPRGDPPGFLRAVDGNTLVIPDRRGNRRADTFHNLMSNDRVSLAALVPGRDDVLHLHGTGYVTDDPSLMGTLALQGKPPHAALVIRVESAQLRVNAAIRHSQLWRPTLRAEQTPVPDLMILASQHLADSKAAGVKGRVLRLLVRLLTGFPGLARRLFDVAYRRQLADEGYDTSRERRS